MLATLQMSDILFINANKYFEHITMSLGKMSDIFLQRRKK